MAKAFKGIAGFHLVDVSEQIKPELLPVKGGSYDVDPNVNVFITQFSSEDVDYFLDFFKDCRGISDDALRKAAIRTLSDWIRRNSGRSPYEPFLWALKISDGIIGSISANPKPNEHTLKPLVEALKEKWYPGDEKVLKNIILNWEWYQPVHVALELYKLKNKEQDPEIDAHIVKRWLYDYMYSHAAYMCLIQKKKTPENIKALMNFVSKNSHDEGRIKIDGTIRKAFEKYANSMTSEENKIAGSYYHELQNCSNEAKENSFGRWAHEDKMVSDVERLLNAYKSAKSEEEKETATRNFTTYCTLHVPDAGYQQDVAQNGQIYKELIQKTSEANLTELITQVTEKLSPMRESFAMQHILGAMCDTKNSQYCSFIEDQYHCFCKNGIENSWGLLYACAYCCNGHPELVGDIVRKFYLEGKGFIDQRQDIAIYSVTALRKPYRDQYYQAISELVDECIQDKTNKTAYNLVCNCRDIFRATVRKHYPQDFNQILCQLTDAAVSGGKNAQLYAETVVETVKCVADVKDRGYYYNNILTRIMQTDVEKLLAARKTADEIIRHLYKENSANLQRRKP